MIQYGSGRYRRGASLIWYARGAGGRICDLPPKHLDMIAEAIIHAHPKYVTRPVRELLVSGRFIRSQHWQLRGVTLAQLRERQLLNSSRAYAIRRHKMITIMSTAPPTV